MSDDPLVKAIMADVNQDGRADLRRRPVRISVEEDRLVLEGVVEDIAAKRVVHNIAHRHSGHLAVLDRLRLDVPVGEGASESLPDLADLLLEEPVFQDCSITLRLGDTVDTLRVGDDDAWGGQSIEIAAREGTLILSGHVRSLTHRRLAEVLAWWAVGCEMVENLLHVVPPEQENDGELADAVRIVLEKDPLVHLDGLGIGVLDGVVTLEGRVASPEERLLVVEDIWYIPGVKDVVDKLKVGG